MKGQLSRCPKAKRFSAFILVLTLILTLMPWAGVSAMLADVEHEPVYATGLIWDSWEVIEANLREYPQSNFASESVLPPSVDLKSEFPTPGNQGQQNSCVGWAVAYALRSHQEEVKLNWGLKVDSQLFSPAYVYNELNGGFDNGINIGTAMGLLAEQGVSTLASFHYNEFDYRTKPTAVQKAEAAHFRVADWYTIRGRDSIKKRLADGDGVVVGIDIFSDFNNLRPSNPIFDVVSGVSGGRHAICLIGYDDNLSAFMFINSWGTGWGLDGYGWISYDLMDDIRVNYHGEAVGYAMDARDDSILYEAPFDYTVSGGEATVMGYMDFKLSGDIIIPKTLGGYPVTAIGDSVFRGMSLPGVVIPDSVTAIGDGAFSNCRSLTSVAIPDSVTRIGRTAFYGCSSLSIVVIGSGLNEVSYSMFTFCTALTEVVIPSNVTKIDVSAFSFCSGLKSVIIGSGVTAIDVSAFSYCTGLTGITVSTNNPNYVSIDGVLFDKSLTTLILYPEGKGGAYTIPNNVTTIGNSAFSDCKGLTGVIIPASVTSISTETFSGCLGLTSITVNANNPDYASIGGVLFDKSLITLILYPQGKLGAYTIPNSVTMIGNSAFSDCMGLTSVVIPASVTSIGTEAFYRCMALTSVVIPGSVTSIGDLAFHYPDMWWGFFPIRNLTIHCYENSYAHNYAIEKGISYVLLDNINVSSQQDEPSSTSSSSQYSESSNLSTSSQSSESSNLPSSRQPSESSNLTSSSQSTESSNLPCTSQASSSSVPNVSSQPTQREPKVIVMRLNAVNALLDGTKIAVDPTNDSVAPFTLMSKTMVPVRFVQQLGADVKYDGNTSPVTVSYGDIVLKLEFDNPVMTKTINGGTPINVTLPTAPTMVEGKTCVPIREVAEGLGFSVKYDASTNVIVVSTAPLSDTEQAAFIKSGVDQLPAFIVGVKGLTVKKTSYSAKIGDTIQLSKADVTFDPIEVGCDKLVYSSNDESVATVTSNGRISARAKGTAQITVSSHNGKTVAITVVVS